MKLNAETLLITFLSLVLNGPAIASDDLEIEDAWIAEAPPVSKVMAAYMEIENETGHDRQATSMQCEEFERAEFHLTVEKDGVARMQPQQVLDIKAGSELELEPGGYHIMLFDPARRMQSGDHTACSMTFDDNSTIRFQLEVRKASVEDHSHHHHH